METVKRLVLLAGVALLLHARPVRAGRDETTTPPEAEETAAPYYDTGRFYFYFESGNAFILNDHLIDDVHLTESNGVDLVLGGAGGYNISDHWGVELQGHGVESDVVSTSMGKLEEYSNITIVPAARFRWPMYDGRFVPFITAGVGWSINADNDQHEPRIKITADDSTIVGAIAAGAEYFLSPNVAVGLTLHSFIFPDQDVNITIRDAQNRVVHDQNGSFNQSSLALLAHVRVFPGAPGSPGDMSLRRFLFADHGPFDTDDRRYYLYLFGGHTAQFDHGFGDGVELADPGDFNATLGGGAGVNLDRHWGVEAQFFNAAPNLNASPLGKFSEIDNITFLLLGRFRWPFLGGRLVPYATAGVGAGTFDLNDSRTVVDIPTEQGTAVTARSPTLTVQATTVAAQAGVGVEYFLNHYLSVGVALPVYIYPNLPTTVQRGNYPAVGGHANFSGIAPQLQVKAYLN